MIVEYVGETFGSNMLMFREMAPCSLKSMGLSSNAFSCNASVELLEFKSDGSLGKSEVKEMVSPPIKIKDIQPKETTTRVIAPKIKDGKFNPNGYNKVYNSNEELYQDGEFKDGRLFNGKMYVYDEDGILLKVKVYKDGAYHSDGQL